MTKNDRPIHKGILFSEDEYKEVEALIEYTGLNFTYLVRSLLKREYNNLK